MLVVVMAVASFSGYVVADETQDLEMDKAVGIEEQTKLAKNTEEAVEILRVIQEVTDELTKEVVAQVEEKKALVEQEGIVDNIA